MDDKKEKYLSGILVGLLAFIVTFTAFLKGCEKYEKNKDNYLLKNVSLADELFYEDGKLSIDSVGKTFYFLPYENRYGGFDSANEDGEPVNVKEIIKDGKKYLVDDDHWSYVLLSDYDSIGEYYELEGYNSKLNKSYVVEIIKHGDKFLVEANNFTRIIAINYNKVYVKGDKLYIEYQNGEKEIFDVNNFKPLVSDILTKIDVKKESLDNSQENSKNEDTQIKPEVPNQSEVSKEPSKPSEKPKDEIITTPQVDDGYDKKDVKFVEIKNAENNKKYFIGVYPNNQIINMLVKFSELSVKDQNSYKEHLKNTPIFPYLENITIFCKFYNTTDSNALYYEVLYYYNTNKESVAITETNFLYINSNNNTFINSCSIDGMLDFKSICINGQYSDQSSLLFHSVDDITNDFVDREHISDEEIKGLVTYLNSPQNILKRNI